MSRRSAIPIWSKVAASYFAGEPAYRVARALGVEPRAVGYALVRAREAKRRSARLQPIRPKRRLASCRS